jgi:hypothetical protein
MQVGMKPGIMQTETVRRDRKHKESAHMAWLTDPINTHSLFHRSNQPTRHDWQIHSAHTAWLTDPISTQEMLHRPNQPTWYIWQIQSAHMACLTDLICTHSMFDRSNQYTWHAWPIQSANLFNLWFRPSMVIPLSIFLLLYWKNPILVTYIYTYIHTYIHTAADSRLLRCYNVCNISWEKVSSFSGSSSPKKILSHDVIL